MSHVQWYIQVLCLPEEGFNASDTSEMSQPLCQSLNHTSSVVGVVKLRSGAGMSYCFILRGLKI